MAYNSGNTNGLATSANSSPVVIASDNVVDTAGNQVLGNGSITAVDSASSTASGQAGQTIVTGTPTAGSVYALAIPNVNGAPESFSSIVINVTGTFVGTYQFERSPDGGTTWAPFSPFVAGQPATTATATLPGMFHGNIAGVTNVRVRCSAYTSGTINVRFSMGIGVGTVTVGNPIRLYDLANNSLAAIKPASTAPAATDTALVTVESPNSPLFTSTLNVRMGGDGSAAGALSSVNSSVTTAALSGVATASVQVTGTWVGTLTPQVSVDGSNYIALSSTGLINTNTGAYTATIGSATGIWQADIAGFNYFRMYMTAYTSGTATVTIRSTAASGVVALDAPVQIASGSNTIGNINSINAAMTPGTASTNLGKAQGNTPGTTDTGVATLAVRAPTTPVARTGTAGNYELVLADAEGKLIAQQYADPATTWYAVLSLNASTTLTSIRAAGASGIRNFVTSVTVSNSSSTGTLATIVDGTGSTVMWQSWVNGLASVSASFPVALRGTAATQVSAQSSSSVGTLYFSIAGYLGI